MKKRIDHSFSKRGKPKIEAPAIPNDPTATFTLGDAASFLAERIIANESERQATRKAVYGRIEYALEANQLKGTAEAISYGELILWARTKKNYLSAIKGLTLTSSELVEENAHPVVELLDTIFPSDSSENHRLLREKITEVERLQNENIALSAELDQAKTELKKVAKRREIGRKSSMKRNIYRKFE